VDVTVAVAIFGDLERWRPFAERAVKSAKTQTNLVELVEIDGGNITVARNTALELVGTEWVVFLDADDELEPGYLDAMRAGTADIRAPRVRYTSGVTSRRPAFPRVAGHSHICTGNCLLQGNWLVVGSMARAQMIRDVGGWREFSWSEDWDLWLRCHLNGATVEGVQGAIYRAHVRKDSRNRSMQGEARLRVHREIEEANGLGPGGTLLDKDGS